MYWSFEEKLWTGFCQIQDFYSRGSGRTTYCNFFKIRKKTPAHTLIMPKQNEKNFYKKKDCYIAAFLKIVDKFTEKFFYFYVIYNID